MRGRAMRGHFYISREGDREVITNYLADFNTKSNAELLADYNKAQAKGFFGAHQQALFIISMHLTFRKRYGKSPVKVTDNTLIEFTSPILQTGNSWSYASTKN